MFGKIAIAQFLIMALMAAGGYFYFRHSQAVISDLTENKARLEVAVRSQEEAIRAQQEFSRRQNDENLRLQQGVADAESRRRDLESRLRRANIEVMARSNRADLERRINQSTEQAFREIERITAPRDRQTDASQPANAPPSGQGVPSTNPQPLPRPPRRDR